MRQGTGNSSASARAAALRSIAIGAKVYDRESILPRLIAVSPADLSDAGKAHVIGLLARALRRERALGRAGHWAYDLSRHFGLAQAYAAEKSSPDDKLILATRRKPTHKKARELKGPRATSIP